MRLIELSYYNLLRKKGRTFFLSAGLAAGIGAAVALTALGDAMNREIMRNLDEFGANIVVLPASEDLLLSYRGMTVSAVSTGGRRLSIRDAEAVRSIRNAANVSWNSSSIRSWQRGPHRLGFHGPCGERPAGGAGRPDRAPGGAKISLMQRNRMPDG